MAEVEYVNASCIYPGATAPSVDSLNLEIQNGEFMVLVGPSGSGKTTAMRLINRMIELTDGDILLGGESVMERDPARLRREIGYVIQQIGLFPHLTVGENIATVPRLLGWPRERIRNRVDELLTLIGMDPAEMRGRYASQLSGGQRQRVGVARGLAADPPLMLMDEPFGAIDPINRSRLQDEFLALHRRVRKTVVFVTHDIDEAIKVGDRIAILRQGGELAQYAPPEELLTHPADTFVAQFVGADRGLKRLGLTTLGDLDLLSADGHSVDGPRLSSRTSLRDALSLMLTIGHPLTVVDDDERVSGIVTIDLVSAVLAGARDEPADRPRTSA